jgi:protein-S-isoprenylcysteine O-methyltransferase Ste14
LLDILQPVEAILKPFIFALVFWATFFFWAIIELRSGAKHKPIKRTASGRRNDVITLLVPTFGLVLAIVFKVTLPDMDMYSSVILFGLGILLAWVGIALRLWAINTLGKYFVMTIGAQAKQPVITKGPYRLIRHPSYLGGFVSVIGVSVALNSLPGTILMTGSAALVILLRVRAEERYLLKKLGKPYATYSAITKKLIPYIF